MKSPPLTRALPLIALVIASLAAFAPGCGGDDPSPPVNGGGSGGSGGSGGTGGTGGDPGCVDDEQCPSQQECVDAACVPISCDTDADCPANGHCPEQPVEGETSRTCQPNCIIDADCGFNNGLRCDDAEASETHGRCIAGEPCQNDFNCGTTPGFDYCPSGACVCVGDTSVDEALGGVCRRKTPTCSPCMGNTDCGSNGFVHEEPAECVSYNFDDENVDVCLPLRNGARCPAGTIPDESGNPELEKYCVPQYGNCADMNPCNSDVECQDNPAAPICDLVRHICVAACRFDFEANTSLGCPPSKVCHTTAAFLAPNLLNECGTVGFFGQGKCGDACVEDSDCAAYDNGTDTFICAQEGNGASAERRCRPESAVDPGTPACLNDRDCPEGTGGKYLGYCDIKTDPSRNECVYDNCRRGQDPRAGCGSKSDFADCTADYKCSGTTLEVGECIEKDCIDKGGANLACHMGQFCAGEPMRNLLTGELDGAPRDPGTVPSGSCYDLEVGPWCERGCTSNADCVTAPAGMPSHGDSPALCLQGDDGVARCNWGCEYGQECPGGWGCSSGGLEISCGARQGGLQRCTSDPNCGGTNKCVEPRINGKVLTEADWGTMAKFKVCECSDSGACGGGFECNAGVGTAGTDPANAETYQVRQARYCAPPDICGANGSCEWLGDGRVFVQDGPREPIFLCGATPDGSKFPGIDDTTIDVNCPATDAEGNPVRQGKTANDQLKCVYSSVCKPSLFADPADPETLLCGVPPQP